MIQPPQTSPLPYSVYHCCFNTNREYIGAIVHVIHSQLNTCVQIIKPAIRKVDKIQSIIFDSTQNSSIIVSFTMRQIEHSIFDEACLIVSY